MIDLPLLHRLLAVHETEPPRRLVRKARIPSSNFAQLVLSVLERDGFPLGTGSRDELRRARLRSATYGVALRLLQVVARARVLKGPSLARLYPPELVRPVGDLDLILPDEESLWRCVRVLTEAFPVTHVDVSLVEGPHRHVFASVQWPSDDPALDAELTVELYTAAYPGDSGAVEIRAQPPDMQLLADLVAVAEERFQRPFQPKDAIDVIAMSWQAELADRELVATIDDYRVAPEVVELLEYASSYHPLGSLSDLAAGLRSSAERERERRASHSGLETAELDVGARLRNGQLVYGLMLSRTAWRSDIRVAEVAHFGSGYLLHTPVGEYLLVASEEVGSTLYDAAMAALAG
jgi:hypothetical protein